MLLRAEGYVNAYVIDDDTGLYWHFVDLFWIFLFLAPYLR